MARYFGVSEGLKMQEYFVYFKFSSRTIISKEPASGDQSF